MGWITPIEQFMQFLASLPEFGKFLEARKKCAMNMEDTEAEIEIGRLLGGKMYLKVVFESKEVNGG